MSHRTNDLVVFCKPLTVSGKEIFDVSSLKAKGIRGSLGALSEDNVVVRGLFFRSWNLNLTVILLFGLFTFFLLSVFLFNLLFRYALCAMRFASLVVRYALCSMRYAP